MTCFQKCVKIPQLDISCVKNVSAMLTGFDDVTKYSYQIFSTQSPQPSHIPPTNRFSYINVDLVGTLPPSEGKNMLLTVIDKLPTWPKAYLLSASGKAASFSVCAKMLIHEWIPQYGVPDIITSSCGSQFVSQQWISLCSLIGIRRATTTAYHLRHIYIMVGWKGGIGLSISPFEPDFTSKEFEYKN